MRAYLDLVDLVLREGTYSDDRTGTGILACIGKQFTCDLAKGFPLLTTKKMAMNSIVHELLWFIRGDTNIRYLKDNGVSIWDAWADENGDLGPIYGKQWRDVTMKDGTRYDPLLSIIEEIKQHSNSRRLLVNSWNVQELNEMRLPPCHLLYQFHVLGNKLHLTTYQRSADLFLGVPFNIASYAILVHMVASIAKLDVGTLTLNFGNLHLYSNHIQQASMIRFNEPRELPKLKVNPEVTCITEFKPEDIILESYFPHPTIKAPVAV